MPEYLSPGVYVEEFEIGARPIEGVSTSTAGFLGETERGPTAPRLITSWLDFQRIYGGHFEKTNTSPYLPFSIEGFFANGGSRCYVARVVSSVNPGGAVTASGNLTDSSPTPVDVITVNAVGEGSWGNGIGIMVGTGTFDTVDIPLFKLTVYYWKSGTVDISNPESADIIEEFDDLSIDSSSDNYYEKKVNGISNLIVLDGAPVAFPEEPIVVTALTLGDDGTLPVDVADYKREDSDTPGSRRGLIALNEIDDISILYAPDSGSITGGLPGELIAACEQYKDRFAVIDCPPGSTLIDSLKPRDTMESMYAAFYYPWIKVYNPLTKMYKSVPPGGHAAGIYARTDNDRGVHKAPANEKVKGIVDLEFQVGKGEQDILNPRGVNCIRAFPGRGIRVWGARTLSANTLWKYINVRRLFIYIEESIEKGTQWVVFEPNDEKLWARIKQTVTQFLTKVWKDGALMGSTPEESFFVKCDRTTMTQDDIDNGRLIVLIGVAPVKPAEFVIFRIAQWQGGSAATE
jgi:Bacteriophage tail sheath protein